MADNQHQIPVDKFVTLTANILHAGFIDRNKAAAKKDFKKLVAGDALDVGAMTQKENGEKIQLSLTMDSSEFKGVLTFNNFQKVLASMLDGIARQLKAEKEITSFTNERSGQTVFFIPGFIEEEGGLLNMLVCGMNAVPGKIGMQLMFLDPEQFRNMNDEEEPAAKTAKTASALAGELSELAETLGDGVSEEDASEAGENPV